MTDLKPSTSHDEKIDMDIAPRSEAEAWVDNLSDAEFAAEQKRLLRKVS